MHVSAAVLGIQGPFGPAPSKHNKKAKCSESRRL